VQWVGKEQANVPNNFSVLVPSLSNEVKEMKSCGLEGDQMTKIFSLYHGAQETALYIKGIRNMKLVGLDDDEAARERSLSGVSSTYKLGKALVDKVNSGVMSPAQWYWFRNTLTKAEANEDLPRWIALLNRCRESEILQHKIY